MKVDAVTGVWLLLSEESRRIGVCARPGDELMLHSVTEIEVHDGSGRKGFRDAVASGGGD